MSHYSARFANPLAVVAVSLAALLALLLRRGNQWFLPQVWNEDGAGITPGGDPGNIPAFLDTGWLSLFEPVNGYLILVPKLITGLALQVSFYEYPLVSTIFSWLFITAIALAVALAPTTLKARTACAMLVFLVPSDPEVFGLPLYTFWWSSLLLFLLVLWREDGKHGGTRSVLLGFAALSSPTILGVLPFFWFRAWRLRRIRIETLLATMATVFGLIQLGVMHQTGLLGSGVGQRTSPADLVMIVPKFLGGYLTGNLYPELQWTAGILLTLFLAFAVTLRPQSRTVVTLALLVAATIAMSISRLDINVIHHADAGPRYFFFPFLLLSWLLVQIVCTRSNRWIRIASGGALALSVINAIPVFDRTHADFMWKEHVSSCRQFDGEYEIPIQVDGSAAHWVLPVQGRACRELLDADRYFDRENTTVTFSYRPLKSTDSNDSKSGIPAPDQIEKNEWLGKDAHSIVANSSTLAGMFILGSFSQSDAEAGELVLNMKRGERVWYRTEPRSYLQRIEIVGHEKRFVTTPPAASEWVLLEFSNASLPDTFQVRFVDGGDGWGEWSAIGLAAE